MTFPLGSLRSDTGASTPSSAPAGYGGTYTRSGAVPASGAVHHPGWREQAALLAGGVLWLLALLALVTHNAADAAFSTSGSSPLPNNKARALGAGVSDMALF